MANGRYVLLNLVEVLRLVFLLLLPSAALIVIIIISKKPLQATRVLPIRTERCGVALSLQKKSCNENDDEVDDS